MRSSVYGPPAYRTPRSCARDEGRPLRVGLQGKVLKRLKLHDAERLQVVSVEEKAYIIRQVRIKR